MHGGAAPVYEMFYGFDDANLYVRLDGAQPGRFGVEFESGPAQSEVARGRIVEMRAARSGRRFRVTAATLHHFTKDGAHVIIGQLPSSDQCFQHLGPRNRVHSQSLEKERTRLPHNRCLLLAYFIGFGASSHLF